MRCHIVEMFESLVKMANLAGMEVTIEHEVRKPKDDKNRVASFVVKYKLEDVTKIDERKIPCKETSEKANNTATVVLERSGSLYFGTEAIQALFLNRFNYVVDCVYEKDTKSFRMLFSKNAYNIDIPLTICDGSNGYYKRISGAHKFLKDRITKYRGQILHLKCEKIEDDVVRVYLPKRK